MTDSSVSIALGDDHADLRRTVGRLCGRYPGEYWRRLEDERGYPDALVGDLAREGLLGCLVPERYGGLGLSLRAAAVILETINRHGCTASHCHAQIYLMGTLLRHGSEEQKRRYLPRIAGGELRLQAFAITERDTGSDTTRIRTLAAREGDHYVISGRKMWASRVLQSDLVLLLARTTPIEECEERSDGLSVFILDMREHLGKGLEVRPIEAMVNHHASELVLDQVRVPADALVGEPGQGFREIVANLNAERILVASEAIGDGLFFIEKALKYADQRVVFGRTIGENQGVQFPLARAYVELKAADLTARSAAALFDAGAPCGEMANSAKLLASEACWHAAEVAMQTFGGLGIVRDQDIERKWRESRIYQLSPIPTNLVLAYIAHQVLGMEKSY